jgi:hypothetical protein
MHSVAHDLVFPVVLLLMLSKKQIREMFVRQPQGFDVVE